jgi:hypothetical protein
MRKSMLATLIFATLSTSPALACGLDGAMNNPFTTAYPGSFGVALGTQQAVGSGQLFALPELDAKAAAARLEARLDQLRVRLEKTGLKGGFAVLVVDSGHWARFSTSGAAVQVHLHAAPAIYDSVLLTSEPALAALLDGQLTMDNAKQAGLVRWSGSQSPVLAQTALASGF